MAGMSYAWRTDLRSCLNEDAEQDWGPQDEYKQDNREHVHALKVVRFFLSRWISLKGWFIKGQNWKSESTPTLILNV